MIVEGLDTKIQGKAAINILVEYGAIAYHCSFPPKNTKLAIVISPPYVRFCPSSNGVEGVFFEDYSSSKHGIAFIGFEKKVIADYSNINARLDAWDFYASILETGEASLKIFHPQKYHHPPQ